MNATSKTLNTLKSFFFFVSQCNRHRLQIKYVTARRYFYHFSVYFSYTKKTHLHHDGWVGIMLARNMSSRFLTDIFQSHSYRTLKLFSKKFGTGPKCLFALPPPPPRPTSPSSLLTLFWLHFLELSDFKHRNTDEGGDEFWWMGKKIKRLTIDIANSQKLNSSRDLTEF